MTEKEVCISNLTSDFVYGHGPSNLKLICESSTFFVHCDVFSQSSEVWEKMLDGAFAESLEESVTLQGDDPRALKLSLDIVYGHLFGKIDATSFEIDSCDRAKLCLFVEKYELNGVSTFLDSVALWRVQLSQLKSLQQQLQLSYESPRTDHLSVGDVTV